MSSLRFVLCSLCLLAGCERPLVLTRYPSDAGKARPDARSPRALSDATPEPRERESDPPSSDDEGSQAPEPAAPDEGLVPEATSAPEPGPPGDSVGGMPSDPECDLRGYWAVQQSLISATELAGPIRGVTWGFLQLAQEGEAITTVDHHECGQSVKGIAEQTVPRDTLAVMATKNSWRGRAATVTRSGDHCEIEFAQAWSVRGADPERYLPAGRFAAGGLDVQREAALPTEAHPEGAENWNGNGELAGPGVAGSITGAATATRWTVQRAYYEWFTSSDYPVEASAQHERLVLGAHFDIEAPVLAVEPPNPLLQTLQAEPQRDHPDNHVTLLFLGREPSDELAAMVVGERNLARRCLLIQNQLLPY